MSIGICDDINYLADMYALEELNFQMAKENVKYVHAYNTIGNPDILTEGFSDMLGNMGNFFKKMIEKIKEFFKKIFMYIASCFMDIDKFVKKYKKELDALNKIDFDIYGHKFTLHDAPNMDEFRKIVDEYNSEVSEANKLKKAEVLARQNDFLKATNLDAIRGKVLGSNQNISEEDFVETVRKYYRNGELEEVEIHIDDAEYRKIVSDTESVVKGKKEAEKTRDELIVLLDKTQKFFNQKASTVYVSGVRKIKTAKIKIDDNKFSTEEGDYVTDSALSVMETYLRFKYQQANKMAGIINTVACERANAFKDQVKFYRQVIRKGLFKDKDDDNKSSES